MRKLYNFFSEKKLLISSIFITVIPFIIYIITLEEKLVGGDTSSYAFQLPQMMVLPPTGYPVFSIIGKIFSIIPIGELAYRLNMISAVFGSLTILFLFLAINNITKNIMASFTASLCFAFSFPYWHVANRLEFDTLNSFIIAVLLFAISRYNNNPSVKNLYFSSLALGFMLTNHPIAFFVMPSFLILLILIKPAIFKRLRTTIICILLFIAPILSYSYVYIRSVQGFGPADTFLKLIYYVTGRNTEGEVFGGSFGDKNIRDILLTIQEYLKIIYNAYGIILIIICFIGFIFLLYKNWKFGVFTFLAIIFNLIITTQYLDWAVENYTLNILLIMSIYTASGFAAIYIFLKKITGKIIKEKTQLPDKKNNHADPYKKPDSGLKIFSIIFFIILVILPVRVLINNYNECNQKAREGIYVFWDEAFEIMENNSELYVFSASANIAYFINTFERVEKNISLTDINSQDFSIQKLIRDIKNGPVYVVGKQEFFNQIFKSEKTGKSFYWERFSENLQLNKISDVITLLEVSSDSQDNKFYFGETSEIKFSIKNNSNEKIKISSMELELPKGLKFVSVSGSGDIHENPGLSEGIYMWVGDDYYVPTGEKLVLAVNFVPERVGELTVKFRITTNEMYFDCADIIIKVK